MGENSTHEVKQGRDGHYLARTNRDTLTLIVFNEDFERVAYTIMLINQDK